MRTNIDIDDELMAAALEAGPYKTKKGSLRALGIAVRSAVDVLVAAFCIDHD